MMKKVVFVDNGVIQRRQKTETQNGRPMLDAIRQWIGQSGDDVEFAVSPFFWIEFSGATNDVIKRIDNLCAGLPALQGTDGLRDWFMQSVATTVNTPGLATELQTLIETGLLKQQGWFLPDLEARLSAMWESEKNEPVAMVRHLAVDRLANQLTRKNCLVTQRQPIEVQSQL